MNKPLLAYFGHHKCATSWVNSILRLVCRDLNLKYRVVHNATMFDKQLDEFVKANRIEFLAYTNARMNYVKALGSFVGFHIIRDPRDIVVSAYFSHLYSHDTRKWPGLVAYREKLHKVSQNEGLLLEIEHSKGQFSALFDWDYSQPNVLEIKMEDLISSPYEIMVQALSHLNLIEHSASLRRRYYYLFTLTLNRIDSHTKGLLPLRKSSMKIPLEILLCYLFDNRYSKKAGGRKRGEEDRKSHYRKGVAGDWVNYFNEEHKQLFKENYNDLLIKLGYEQSTNW